MKFWFFLCLVSFSLCLVVACNTQAAPAAPSKAKGDVGFSRSNPIPMGVPFLDDDGNEVTVLRADRFGRGFKIDIRVKCLQDSDVKCIMDPVFETVGDSGQPPPLLSQDAFIMYGGASETRSLGLTVRPGETGVVLAFKTSFIGAPKNPTRFIAVGDATNPLPGSPENPVPVGTSRIGGGWMEMRVVDAESTLTLRQSKFSNQTIRSYNLCVTSRFRYVGDPSFADEVTMGDTALYSPEVVKRLIDAWGKRTPMVRASAGARFVLPKGAQLGGSDPFEARACFTDVMNDGANWQGWLMQQDSTPYTLAGSTPYHALE